MRRMKVGEAGCECPSRGVKRVTGSYDEVEAVGLNYKVAHGE